MTYIDLNDLVLSAMSKREKKVRFTVSQETVYTPTHDGKHYTYKHQYAIAVDGRKPITADTPEEAFTQFVRDEIANA